MNNENIFLINCFKIHQDLMFHIKGVETVIIKIIFTIGNSMKVLFECLMKLLI